MPQYSRKSVFSFEHEAFRDSFAKFLDTELMPHIDAWEETGCVEHDFWRKAGKGGFLGIGVPEEYGGPGGDFLHRVIRSHELGYCIGGASISGVLENDLIVYAILSDGTEEQKRRWLPGIASGDIILAGAYTEPQSGSDMAGMKTTAVRDGDEYVINGSKTYISCGATATLIRVACKTDPDKGTHGISAIFVEADRKGYRRGRILKKMGIHAGDLCEMFFDNVRVPVTNLLAAENGGFKFIMENMARDRMCIAARALGSAKRAFELTAAFVKQRIAFGQPVSDFQNTQFRLADMKTDITAGETLLHDCIAGAEDGSVDNERAAMAKLWITEMEARVTDIGVQLHGGAGYMDEYPISKLYTAARVHRIYAGSSEVMRWIIGRKISAS
jgi:acyl-CoA dehydrogenase